MITVQTAYTYMNPEDYPVLISYPTCMQTADVISGRPCPLLVLLTIQFYIQLHFSTTFCGPLMLLGATYKCSS